MSTWKQLLAGVTLALVVASGGSKCGHSDSRCEDGMAKKGEPACPRTTSFMLSDFVPEGRIK